MNDLIRYDEIFTVSRGVFNHCNFSVEGYTVEELNLLCLTNFGSYYLAPVVTYLLDWKNIDDENLILLGELIGKRFGRQWVQCKELLNENYSVLANYETIEQEEYNSSINVSDENLTNQNSDVFAFNSDESVPNTQNASQSKSNKVNEINTIRTKRNSGYNASYTPRQMISEEIEFRRRSLVDYIMIDLKEYLTLPIC